MSVFLGHDDIGAERNSSHRQANQRPAQADPLSSGGATLARVSQGAEKQGSNADWSDWVMSTQPSWGKEEKNNEKVMNYCKLTYSRRTLQVTSLTLARGQKAPLTPAKTNWLVDIRLF